MNRSIRVNSIFGAFYLLVVVFAINMLMGCSRSFAQSFDKIIIPDPDKRLEWFKEAKSGMFIHWGPYSLLAGEWNGRQVKVGKNAEWIMKELKIPVKEYRELAHEMNPVQFNAQEFVRLAKAAGMKYIVITANEVNK